MFEFLARWLPVVGSQVLDTGVTVGLSMAASMTNVLLAFVALMGSWTVLKGVLSQRGGKGFDFVKELFEFMLIALIFLGLLQRYGDIMGILRSLFEGVAGAVSSAAGGPPLAEGLAASLKPLDDAITTIWAAMKNLPGPSTGTFLDWLSPSRLGYLVFAPIASIVIWLIGAFLCFVFISGNIMMGIGFGIGPLFITLGYFKPTRSFLDSWIKYIFSAGLVQYVVAFLAIAVKSLMGLTPYLVQQIGAPGDPIGEFVTGMAVSMAVVVVALICAGVAWLARNQAEALVRGMGAMDLGAAMVGGVASVAATMASGASKGVSSGSSSKSAGSAGGAGTTGGGTSGGPGGSGGGGSGAGASAPAGAAGGAATPTVSPSYSGSAAAQPHAAASIPGAVGFGDIYAVGAGAARSGSGGAGADSPWANFGASTGAPSPASGGSGGSSQSNAAATPGQGAAPSAPTSSPDGATAATAPSRDTQTAGTSPSSITAPSSSGTNNKSSALTRGLVGALTSAPLAAVAGVRGFMDGRTVTLRTGGPKTGGRGKGVNDGAEGTSATTSSKRRDGAPNEAPGRPPGPGGARNDRGSDRGAGRGQGSVPGTSTGEGAATGASASENAGHAARSGQAASPAMRPSQAPAEPPPPHRPPAPVQVPGPNMPADPSAADSGSPGDRKE